MNGVSDWEYKNIMDLVSDETPGHHRIAKSDYQTRGKTPIVDQSIDFIAGYTDEDSTLLDPPYIIFGDHTREIKYLEQPFLPGAQGVRIFRAKKDVDSKFLYYYLAFKKVQNLGYSRHFKLFKQVEVLLPPLVEQQRIAEILDQSQSLINDSLILEEKSETLLKASFIAAFGHPLDPANPINRQRVGAVSKVITGNTPPRKDPSNYGSTVEWLKSDNLGGLQPTPAAELLSDVGARKARLVEPGATLITCIAGSRESIGKSSLLDRTAAFNQQINAIVPGEELDPLFLFAQVKTAPELIRREATDGMKGIVSKKTLESVKILVPSVHAQKQFSEAATKFMSLKDYTQRRTSELRTLHESLSTRAFAGQL